MSIATPRQESGGGSISPRSSSCPAAGWVRGSGTLTAVCSDTGGNRPIPVQDSASSLAWSGERRQARTGAASTADAVNHLADARCNEPQHPSQVGRRHQVHGVAHEVGTDDGALRQRLFDVALRRVPGPQPHCPRRREVALGRHRPGHSTTSAGPSNPTTRCGWTCSRQRARSKPTGALPPRRQPSGDAEEPAHRVIRHPAILQPPADASSNGTTPPPVR